MHLLHLFVWFVFPHVVEEIRAGLSVCSPLSSPYFFPPEKSFVRAGRSLFTCVGH